LQQLGKVFLNGFRLKYCILKEDTKNKEVIKPQLINMGAWKYDPSPLQLPHPTLPNETRPDNFIEVIDARLGTGLGRS
jgi:hypothetical protein